ncbi:RNA pseudouridine synthase [Sphingorhabdus lutea]|uniref:Ribosomal large subunit pseudouridine synthase D n=1 Tax=Sphingorhabdus lutea TaxID=1913578 RepID=A0A1L3JDZ2_9SPHN|nr:RluA family pseudouridine synthase [Sphingorhabdus lutea]APG63344.1 RNA pseudouridine synthase [Sphingorhabdus lutea]
MSKNKQFDPEMAKEPEISDQVKQYIVKRDDDGIRLDRWFKRNLPDVNFALISRLTRTGQVRVDGKRVAPADRVATGQTIRVPPIDPQIDEQKQGRVRRETNFTDEEIDQIRSMVIHRDRAAIVINKPPGLATQGGSKTTTHVDGMLDALCFENNRRPKLVHRLDKDTSGVLLLARSPGTAAHFSKSFSDRSARKIYWAIIMGIPDIADGIIDLPIGKQPGTGGEKMHVDHENGQSARTRYRMIERAGNSAAWVELIPFTGRTHQLRVHMAAIGHPIVGDGKYGGKDAMLTGSISRKMHLHARRLRIDHPDGGRIDVKAELPEHFAATMRGLGFDLSLGDTEIDDGPPPPSKQVLKQQAKNYAKQIRKDKRGERRARGVNEDAGKKGARRKDGRDPTRSRFTAGGKPTTRGKSRAAEAEAEGRPIPRGRPKKASPLNKGGVNKGGGKAAAKPLNKKPKKQSTRNTPRPTGRAVVAKKPKRTSQPKGRKS